MAPCGQDNMRLFFYFNDVRDISTMFDAPRAPFNTEEVGREVMIRLPCPPGAALQPGQSLAPCGSAAHRCSPRMSS